MTEEQQQDLLNEWNRYDHIQQAAILDEFRRNFSDEYTKSRFLKFLKEKNWISMGLRQELAMNE
jgi:hypothetical protein